MASSRLTAAIKDTFISNMVSSLFTKRRESLAKDFQDVSQLQYESTYDQATREWMVNAPQGAFSWVITLGIYVKVGTKRSYVSLALPKAQPVFADRNYPDIIMDSPVGIKYTKYLLDKETLDADKDAVCKKARAILNSCTTTKKLLEVWPEAKEYLPPTEQPMMYLTVIPTDLNNLIKSLKAAA